MSNIEFIDVIVIICHLSVSLTLWILGGKLIKKSKGKPDITKNYILGISMFMLLYGISRIFMFYFELQSDPFIWYLLPDQTETLLNEDQSLSRIYDICWYSGTAISSFAIAILLYELEKHILQKKTKFVLTIFQIATITLGLIFGASSATEVGFGKYMLYISSIPALFIPVIFIYYAIKTAGDTQKRAALSAMGFILFFVGSALNSTLGKNISINLWGEVGVLVNYILYGIFSSLGMIIYHKSLVF